MSLDEEMKSIEISDNCSHKNNYSYVACNELPTMDFNNVNYKFFFEKYMLNNLPCLVRNITQNWKCNDLWVRGDEINCEYFKQQYGDLLAPVANCDKIEYNAQCKNDWNVNDFMDYLMCREKNKLYYLKDWHLRKLRPAENFYEVPHIFASDWLNEFSIDNHHDDFMFVYIGPSGSWTPLHADVYNSYSWSTNIVGKKKWTLFYPGEEDKLKDSFGNLPLQFYLEHYSDVRYIEVIQNTGEAIFVPSGWHHQVQNLETTISINHNWINGCNIEKVWESLQNNLQAVIKEIEEFKGTPDFTSQCQLLLKSVFGMDFPDFVNFLGYIAEKRIRQIKLGDLLLFNKYSLGINHIKFDLGSILHILNSIKHHVLYKDAEIISKYNYNIEDIITRIQLVV